VTAEVRATTAFGAHRAYIARPAPFRRTEFDVPQNHDYNANILDFADYNSDAPPQALYGVELELAPRGRTMAALNSFQSELIDRFRAHPIFICKHDSSIPDGGSELVTLPLTLAEQRDFFNDGLGTLQHARATPTCGMHIHASFDSVTPAGNPARPPARQILRMLQFIFSPLTGPFIDAIARRAQNDFCHRYVDHSDLARWAFDYSTWRRSSSNQHHHAISFSHRFPTIEFRMFAATIDPHVMQANLEFVDALMHFCAILNVPLTSRSFTEYVAARSIDYPQLHQRLRRAPLRRTINDAEADPLNLGDQSLQERVEHEQRATDYALDILNNMAAEDNLPPIVPHRYSWDVVLPPHPPRTRVSRG